MNKYTILLLSVVISAHMYAMDKKQSKPSVAKKEIIQNSVERTMIRKALSTISFNKNERILQLSDYRCNIHKKKSLGVHIYDIDIETLNKMEEAALTYDKILSFTSWNIFRKSPEIFKKSIALLKPQGQLCLVVPYYKSPYLEIYNQTIADKKWKDRCNLQPLQYFSRKAIKRLNTSGKINVECELIKEPFTFKNSNGFEQWVKASTPQFLESLFWWYHTELAHDIAQNYLKKYPLISDKSVQLYFSYLVVKGTKL